MSALGESLYSGAKTRLPREQKMTTIDLMSVTHIIIRLAQFIKPEFMPVNAAQVQAWCDEASNNEGYVQIPRSWAISGHSHEITL